MGDALRWFILAHAVYALGLLPWALVLLVVLRRGGPLRPLRERENDAGEKPASQAPERLPRPPLMDLTLEPFDPSPPAWVANATPTDVVQAPKPERPPQADSDASQQHTEAQRRVQDRRLSRAEARDLARSALLRLSGSGHYAFEDLLVSGVGAIDQLVVGPSGLHVILVSPERGHVWREADGQITYSIDAVVDLQAGTIKGTFETPEEDLDAIAQALVDDVCSKLGDVRTSVLPVVVFPHAEVYSGPGGGRAIVSVWNLAEAIDDPGDRHLSPEAAEDLASRLARAYGREPWMRPTPDHETCNDA